VRLDDVAAAARRPDRPAEENVVDEDEIGRPMVAQGPRVRLDPGVELCARAVLDPLDLVAVVAVEHEHGQQPVHVRLDRVGAAEIKALWMRLLGEDGHVVSLAHPLTRQLARVDVRASAPEEVAMPYVDPHQRGHGNRCGPAGSFSAVRILYGVNGEGMGHATRSEVVIGALLKEHDVRVMASGAAFKFLEPRLGHVSEIFGPSFAMDHGEIRRWATVRHTMTAATRELPGSVKRWMGVVDEWRPEVVVTDFEPLSGIYARSSRTPLVCVDNIHMIDRCRHDEEITDGAVEDYRIARAVTRAMVPTAGDYVITTFFKPPLARGRTVLVPPIVRPEIVAATPVRGDHLLVYSGGSDELTDALRDCGVPSRVYGMRDGEEVGTKDGSIEYRARSVDGFLDDLVSARGVITGGGFSLLSEAVYLGKPVLSVPLRGQFEQLMNARYLHREGFGMCAPAIDAATLSSFLDELDGYHERLEAYVQDGNVEAIDTITERVTAAGADTRRDRARARRAAKRRAR
jgi:uncharacterized protein (TIGR00661 family)